MSEDPRGYKILSKQHTAKSVLYFVRRWGRRYVIKEYTDYRFSARKPGEMLTDALKAAEKRTEVYFLHLQKTAQLMRRSVRWDALLNVPVDVFRQGRSIYKVTHLIEACDIEAEQLHEELDFQQMTTFLCTLLSQMETLAEIGFIHCDIKPENVMICQKRDGTYSAALIDYDSGIIIADDDTHYVDYTPEYASPELHLYKARENEADADELRTKLTCAADMFSTACLIIHYLTGEPLGTEEMIPAEMMNAGRILYVPKVHPVWRALLKMALRFEPERRLSVGQMLAGVTDAQRSGLLNELNRPFGGCGDGKTVQCGMGWVRKDARQSTMLWHLEHCWVSAAPGRSSSLWQMYDASVHKLREHIMHLCKEISRLRDERAALFSVWTRALGHRFFVEQELPLGDCMKLSDMKLPLSTEDADRFMITVLKGVGRLHEHGMLCCLLDVDDIWAAVRENGSIQPIIGGLHWVLKKDEMMDRERMDVYPRIASPEVCLYLGQNDAEMRAQIAQMIGPWSDLFNLGAVYHMLLTGMLPYMTGEGERFLGEAVCMADGEIPPLLLGSSLDARRRKLIAQMLSYEPEDRPESCADVIAQIEAFTRKKKQSEPGQSVSENQKVGQEENKRNAAAAKSEAEEELLWSDRTQQQGDAVYVDEDGLIWSDMPTSAEETAQENVEFEQEDELIWTDVPAEEEVEAESREADEDKAESADDAEMDDAAVEGYYRAFEWSDVKSDGESDESAPVIVEETVADAEDAQTRVRLLHQLEEMLAGIKTTEGGMDAMLREASIEENAAEDKPDAQKSEEPAGEKQMPPAPKEYVLLNADGTGGWRTAQRVGDGEKAWAHFIGGWNMNGSEPLERMKRIARRTRSLSRRCRSILPSEGFYPADGSRMYTIVLGEHGSCSDMADEEIRTAASAGQIDSWMREILQGVQAVHESGMLCGAVTAENVVLLNGQFKFNIAETAVSIENNSDISIWRSWMRRYLIGADRNRDKRMTGSYLSPEVERFVRGESAALGKTSDIFSLGMLYHVLWCGQLPTYAGVKGGWDGILKEHTVLLNMKIPFAQRLLIERMISYDPAQRPQSCEEVIAAIDIIVTKRTKTHSVTVKRGDGPVAGKKAWLYAETSAGNRFVDTAMTDRTGRAVFTGYLPEGKYFVRCDGERVNCRWRSF